MPSKILTKARRKVCRSLFNFWNDFTYQKKSTN